MLKLARQTWKHICIYLPLNCIEWFKMAYFSPVSFILTNIDRSQPLKLQQGVLLVLCQVTQLTWVKVSSCLWSITWALPFWILCQFPFPAPGTAGLMPLKLRHCRGFCSSSNTCSSIYHCISLNVSIFLLFNLFGQINLLASLDCKKSKGWRGSVFRYFYWMLGLSLIGIGVPLNLPAAALLWLNIKSKLISGSYQPVFFLGTHCFTLSVHDVILKNLIGSMTKNKWMLF